jgi:hypothetical protein
MTWIKLAGSTSTCIATETNYLSNEEQMLENSIRVCVGRVSRRPNLVYVPPPQWPPTVPAPANVDLAIINGRFVGKILCSA